MRSGSGEHDLRMDTHTLNLIEQALILARAAETDPDVKAEYAAARKWIKTAQRDTRDPVTKLAAHNVIGVRTNDGILLRPAQVDELIAQIDQAR